MSPESQWLEDAFPIEIAHFQRTFVSFRRVYWVNEPIPISSITVTVVGELLHSTTESLPIPWIIWGSYSWGRFLPSLRKPWDLIHPKFHMESPFFPCWRTLKLRQTWTCASETWSPAAAAKTWCNITFLKRFPYKMAPSHSYKWDYNPIKWSKINGQLGLNHYL